MCKRKRRLALFLVMAMVLALAPAVSLAATLPCGHKDTNPGNHGAASCSIPGHYNCDGKKHDMITCAMEYASAAMEGMDLSGVSGITLPDFSQITDFTIPELDIDPRIEINTDVNVISDLDNPSFESDMQALIAYAAMVGISFGDYPDSPPPAPPPMPPVPPGNDPPKGVPIEFAVSAGLDADFKFEEQKVRELEEQTVWTISIRNTFDWAPSSFYPEWFDQYVTVRNLEATKVGSGSMFGEYSVTGNLEVITDASRLEKLYGDLGKAATRVSGVPVITKLDMVANATGPLVPFDFVLGGAGSARRAEDDDDFGTLVPSKDDDDFGSLVAKDGDDDLASLVWHVGFASAEALWQWHMANSGMSGSVTGPGVAWSITGGYDNGQAMPLSLTFYVYEYGGVKLVMSGLWTIRPLEFWGTISKKIY